MLIAPSEEAKISTTMVNIRKYFVVGKYVMVIIIRLGANIKLIRMSAMRIIFILVRSGGLIGMRSTLIEIGTLCIRGNNSRN